MSAWSGAEGRPPRFSTCPRERATRRPLPSKMEMIQSSGTRCCLITSRVSSARTRAVSTYKSAPFRSTGTRTGKISSPWGPVARLPTVDTRVRTTRSKLGRSRMGRSGLPYGYRVSMSRLPEGSARKTADQFGCVASTRWARSSKRARSVPSRVKLVARASSTEMELRSSASTAVASARASSRPMRSAWVRCCRACARRPRPAAITRGTMPTAARRKSRRRRGTLVTRPSEEPTPGRAMAGSLAPLLAFLRVRYREADEEQDGEVVVLRAAHPGRLVSHHRVRLRVELVDPHLGLPAIALPLEEGDLRDGEVHHGSLEGRNADEGRVLVGPQHGGEQLHLEIRRGGHRAHAVRLEPGNAELLHEGLVRLVPHHRVDVDGHPRSLQSRDIELAERALERADHELLSHPRRLSRRKLARQRAAPEQEQAEGGDQAGRLPVPPHERSAGSMRARPPGSRWPPACVAGEAEPR